MEQYGQLPIISLLAPNVSYKRLTLKFILFCIAYAIVVLALARPQFGSRIKEVKNRGVEIVVALDVSNSMLADDFKPDDYRQQSWPYRVWLINFETTGLVW